MMLNEQQLLILDEFMYTDIASKNQGRTVDEALSMYRDADGNIDKGKLQAAMDANALATSGDIHNDVDKVAEVLTMVNERPELTKLRIEKTTAEYEGSIRGALFVDTDSQDATVAFRGTGGSFEQWNNNFEGFGDVSQQSQRDADAFIKSIPDNYNSLSLTGHSNGCNMAMYATIRNGDKVTRCVGYEGQGFSWKFHQEYADEIAKYSDKITNISSYRDPVHAIMHPIAGKEIYVDDAGKGIVHHGGLAILEKEEQFEKNGKLREDAARDEALGVKLFRMTSQTLDRLSDVPIIGPALEFFMDTVGVLAGIGFSQGLNIFNLTDPKVVKTWLMAYEKIKENVMGYIRKHAESYAKAMENGFNALKSMWDGACEWVAGLFGGGDSPDVIASGGGSGGRANVIRVSTEDMEACIARYVSCREELMHAVAICNNASEELAASWAGPSFLSMTVRLGSTCRNISQSMERIDDAIDELQRTIRTMESAERLIQNSATSLEIGVSPFA